MTAVIYTYAPCGTCRAATHWLRDRKQTFEERPIRETPPSVAELEKMLAWQKGDLKRLFNSSGLDYRAMNLKEKLPNLSVEAALQLLSGKGNLVKRPFLLTPKFGLVGFDAAKWAEAFDR